MCTFFSLKEKIPSWSHFQSHPYHFSHGEFVPIKVCRDVESFIPQISRVKGFPGSSVGKESTCNAGDMGLIPGSERSPGGETGNSFQYSCLENPMDRTAWWATVHWISKSQTQLSNWAHTQAVYIVWGLFEHFWKCIYMGCMYTYIRTWDEG